MKLNTHGIVEHIQIQWGQINDVHTLRCLISKINGHIDFLSQWRITDHGVVVDTTESRVWLGIIRDACEQRIVELSNSFTGGNPVNSPQLPSPIDVSSRPLLAESSAQGAARAIREATQESWARARWEARFRAQQQVGYEAVEEARLRAQQVAHEAAEVARVRNANMQDSSSTSYKGKGKSTDK